MARRSSVIAWGVWGLSIALLALALVLLVLAISAPLDEGAFAFRGYASLISLAFGTVGLLIAVRRPENPIGWVFVCGGLLISIVEVSHQYSLLAVVVRPELPGGGIAAWISNWLWVPALGAMVISMLVFPDGHLPSPRWRLALAYGATVVTLLALGLAFTPGPLDSFRRVENPFGVDVSWLATVTERLGYPLFAGLLVIVGISLALRLRQAHGDEREQLRWVTFAGLVLPALFLPYGIAYSFLDTGPVVDALESLVVLGVVGYAIAVGVAILKYRLYDIDVVINRAVVFGVVAAFITAVYVAIVVGVGALIGQRGDPVLSALAAATVALAFQPVRRRATRIANRLVFGERATPYEVLAEFSERVAGAYETDDVLPRMATVLGEGAAAQRARVWLRIDDELRPVAVWPSTSDAGTPIAIDGHELPAIAGVSAAAPVRHRGELLGALTMTKPPSDPISPSDEKLVRDLAHQAGFVLRNARLVEELRASRQRLVHAQDEERRKLERDIHDGAQQQLVALAVKVRLADGMVERDPVKTRQLLAEIQAETTETLETLRDLARGIFPPLLADRGLAAALQAHARKVPVPVEVVADGIGRFPQDVEAAAYFCCLEALQNVAKYADATRVVVTLARTDGDLRFEVADDGKGFDVARTSRGSGLRNMADRLDALGGAVEIRSAPGRGATTAGRIPVPSSLT